MNLLTRDPRLESSRDVVVQDATMCELIEQLERVSRGPISVLILGETGVGKELLAERLHATSGRKGPFVALSCAALNEHLLESELFGHERGAFTGALTSKQGLLETANGGTLFLDEIGELPLTMQVKLLRVLEERKVLRVGSRIARDIDIRLVSATHRDLERAIERGEFRADLYYRVNGISFSIPPLRHRRSEIGALAEYFVQRAPRPSERKAPRLSQALLSVLANHSWPGNVRELRNVLERAVLLCDGPELLPEHLPANLTTPPPPGVGHVEAPDRRARLLQELEALDRQRVIQALARCAGNQTQAAELLGMSRRTLVSRLQQYNVPRPRAAKRTPQA